MIGPLILGAALLASLGALYQARRRLRAAELECARIEAEHDSARLISERANDPMLVADLLDGSVIEANRAMHAMLDYPRPSLIGRKYPELHPKDLITRSAQVIAEVWEKKGLVYSDLPFVTQHGETVDVEVSASVFDYRGKPAILIYARDIRRRLEAERQIHEYAGELEARNQQLQEAQAKLVESEKLASVGNLAAGIAHELNTPIGAIGSNADVMKRALEILSGAVEGTPLAEQRKVQRALRSIRTICSSTVTATTRVRTIVDSLRNFTRLDEAERQRVDLHEGIESTLVLLKSRLEGVQVLRRFAELPVVCCFPSRLNQVYMHVLSNAVDAMGGSGEITISSAREGAGHVKLSFEDDGPGIAEQRLATIFEAGGFGAKDGRVRSGLGLTIVRRVMEDHGGEVNIRSTLGEGTTVELILPIESS